MDTDQNISANIRLETRQQTEKYAHEAFQKGVGKGGFEKRSVPISGLR